MPQLQRQNSLGAFWQEVLQNASDSALSTTAMVTTPVLAATARLLQWPASSASVVTGVVKVLYKFCQQHA